MNLTNKLLVTLPSKPDWGPGKVLSMENKYANILFRDDPDQLLRKFPPASDVLKNAESQSDPLLDNLTRDYFKEYSGSKYKRLTIVEAVKKFLKKFPKGFYDPKYLDNPKLNERAVKLKASEKYKALLKENDLKELIKEKNTEELSKIHCSVLVGLPLLSPQETLFFKECSMDKESFLLFIEALSRVLDSKRFNKEVMATYFEAVLGLNSAINSDKPLTWQVATIFPFLAMPNTHMFLKPTVIKEAADRLGFELNYDAKPNRRTYESLMKMSDIYMEQIKELKPRDYIDIQFFLSVVRDKKA